MRTDTCRTCGAPIFWAENERTDKPMLFDAEPVEDPGDPDKRRLLWVLDGDKARRARSGDPGPLYAVHWGTCPDAKEWRDKSRKSMLEQGRIEP